MSAETTLDVYGLGVRIHSDWDEVVENLRLDFAWFERNGASTSRGVDVRVERSSPDFDRFGELPASFVTPRNVVYQANGKTIVDYFGRAVTVYDRRADAVVVQGEDQHLVHEAAYHFIVSAIGRHLESRWLPRLHALGVVGAQGGVAIMLPSGGGKSTLALRMLQTDGIKLLSEDTPLLDRRGDLHPFPLRIGVNATDAATLPSDKVRRIERMEFHPKVVLEVGAFADRIQETPAPLRHLVLGRRTLGRDARLEPVSRRTAVGPLIREFVVGVGVYQGMEFVLQRGMRDVLRHPRPAIVRSVCFLVALRAPSVWRLTVGRDHDRNWEALEPLLT
jgi:hypothetical protein